MLGIHVGRRGVAITVALAFFTGAVAAQNLDLDAPLSRLLSPGKFAQIRLNLNRRGRGPRVDEATPLAEILGAEFYARCLRPTPAGDVTKDFSPLFRGPARAVESTLREVLAPHWLSLNLSAEDLESYRRGERGLDLKPLRLFDFTGPTGRPLRPACLGRRGLFVIRDFLNAYAEELKIPPEHRFIDNYKRRESAVLSMKAVIEHDLERGCARRLATRPR